MNHINNLPDEVLCHVLSFLTTKEAALTSILSKRWQNLLPFVPNLHIDDTVFLHPEKGKRDRPEIIHSFMAFVDRVLTLQGDSPINKVSFKCFSAVDSNRVDSWITKVLDRRVSDLDICIILDKDEEEDDDHNYRLSPKSFESKTLMNLKIDCGVEISWLPGCVSLPMLKTLVIDSARVHKFDNFLHDLPKLEELDLVNVVWQDMDLVISSVSLKSLTMYSGEHFGDLSFVTPNLVYFHHSDFVAEDYPVVEMENLVEARIFFLVSEDEIKRARAPDNNWLENHHMIHMDNVVLRYTNAGKLINGIRNVQYLDLSANTLEVLSLCIESIPVFNNLKSLAITSDEKRGWQAMPNLLTNCPNLEFLVLEGLLHYETDRCGDACNCISREDKGRSLASSPVKMLEIRKLRGTMKEMRMIKHFLDYFPSLKEMEVYAEEDDTTELRNLEKLDLVVEMFGLYNKLSSCDVQIFGSSSLHSKWTAQSSH